MVGKGGFIGMAMPCSSTKKPPTMSATWRLWWLFRGVMRSEREEQRARANRRRLRRRLPPPTTRGGRPLHAAACGVIGHAPRAATARPCAGARARGGRARAGRRSGLSRLLVAVGLALAPFRSRPRKKRTRRRISRTTRPAARTRACRCCSRSRTAPRCGPPSSSPWLAGVSRALRVIWAFGATRRVLLARARQRLGLARWCVCGRERLSCACVCERAGALEL